MTQQEYEQQRRELWEEFRTHVICGTDNPKGWFERAFDRAYALGKQEKDEEVEEMLTCDRDVVRMLYDGTDSVKVRQVLEGIFGSKCLPDEASPKEATSAESATPPAPAEPKSKDSDNHLADVGKMMDRRLTIAAQITASIYSNDKTASRFDSIEALVRKALDITDALIAEAERTDKLNK